MMAASLLQKHLAKRRHGILSGVTSVCSAHPWVIRASAEQALESGQILLIEATSNQVNQFGGYTGMRPEAFRKFVLRHVADVGLSDEKLVLGGDHLGPNPWRNLPASEAMAHAETMVTEYVRAGFTKIHLDASMQCIDDAVSLPDETIAQRTLQLCRAAERAVLQNSAPVYVIGTEVPVPGGATHSVHKVEVTSVSAAAHTFDVHRRLFQSQGLEGAWSRVIALVVQPGVEFGHDSVVDYDRAEAQALKRWLQTDADGIVFEAHSTDYQLPSAYGALVQDGFAILKVGPALTFAMREALYALEDIETQLVSKVKRSSLSRVVEDVMLGAPADWQPYYAGSAETQKLMRVYSYSDRVRYYWQRPEVALAVNQLISNLSTLDIPESMCSQYLPRQYARLRSKELKKEPVPMIVDHIRMVLRGYATACDRY